MPLPRLITSNPPFISSLARSSSARTLALLADPNTPRRRANSLGEINPRELATYNVESQLIQARHRFYNDMHIIAPLAEAYQFSSSDIATIIFVISCAASGLPLYIIGSASQVEMVEIFGTQVNLYVLGAAYANFLQNILYAWSFAKAARNFENENKTLLGWSIFWGVTTAVVPSVAMFKLGLRREYSLFNTTSLTLMTFTSTAPLSFFGIYEALKRYLFQLSNNPRAREFLLNQLRKAAKSPRELSVLRVHSNELVSRLSWELGLVIGASQIYSLWPWFCDTEVTLASLSPEALAWMVSVGFFNLPNILIGGIFSGFDTGELIVGGTFLSLLYLTGRETYYSTTKESIVTASMMMIGLISLYFCFYSSATSYEIAETECPSLGVMDFITLQNVKYGTIWGNFILTMLSVAGILKIQTQLSNMRDWIYTAATDDVEKVANDYFPESKEQWQRPATAPAKKSSMWSFLNFGRKQETPAVELPLLNKTKDGAHVELIDEEKGVDTTYQSIGSIAPKRP